MYHTILFDLDGTLTDSSEGIIRSVQYALSKYGIEADKEELLCFIGPPLQDSFTAFYGFSEEKSLEAVSYFREYFKEKGMYENQVYPGIPEMLQTLQSAGKRLLIATSKPQGFAIEILRYFKLDIYFDFVAGATMDGTRRRKGDIIDYALRENAIEPSTSVVMVGDREHDVLGAIENQTTSVGVLYGFGSRKELEQAGADYIIESVEELVFLQD